MPKLNISGGLENSLSCGSALLPVSHLHLLLQLSFLFSVDSDNEVLGLVHSRATGANLVGVKRPLHCVPLLCCV